MLVILLFFKSKMIFTLFARQLKLKDSMLLLLRTISESCGRFLKAGRLRPEG